MRITTPCLLALLTACAGGADGKPALVRVVPEAAGANCTTGGASVQTGLDKNGNGTLDDDEVNASQSKYLCQGAAGPAGATGEAGPGGANGTNGSNGTDGLPGSVNPGANALSTLVAEAAGLNCEHGGSRIDVGLDGNRNGTLEGGEITSTQFICQNANIDSLYFGNVFLHGATDVAQLAGVKTLIGSLNVENDFTGPLEVEGLERISGELRIIGGSSVRFSNLLEAHTIWVEGPLTTLEAPKLETANEIEISNSPALVSVDFAALKRVDGRVVDGKSSPDIVIEYNVLLTELSLPSLEFVRGLHVRHNPLLTQVSLEKLEQALYVSVQDNQTLESLAMPVLARVHEEFTVSGNSLLDECAVHVLVRDAAHAEYGNVSGNKPSTCTASEQCKVIAVADTVDRVYQCAVPAESFAAARASCAELGAGADLYFAKSDAEWLAFHAVGLAEVFKVRSYLGYSDAAEEGTWVASSGFVGYDPTVRGDFWYPGQPSTALENYGQLLEGGLVNDVADGPQRFICRVP